MAIMKSKSACPMVESVTGIASFGHQSNNIKTFSHWTLKSNSMRIGHVHTLHSQFCLRFSVDVQSSVDFYIIGYAQVA